MTEFTPVPALVGGALIGLAAALLLLANGRVAGVSGIVANAIWPPAGEGRAWRVAFVAGLPLGAGIVSAVSGGLTVKIAHSPVLLVASGLLVAFGTRLGNGCTSGHGVCGLARGSKRSLVATLTFMGIGVLTVFVVRHVLAGAAV